MKQLILFFTVTACIAFAAGCTEQTPVIPTGSGITINRVPKEVAYDAIMNYGVFVGENGYKTDSATVAWLIDGSDFLLAMGIDSATACSILQKASHRSIHAYVGIPDLIPGPEPMSSKARLNLQLYLVGADKIITNKDTLIIDQDSSGIYNLTLPCPSACASVTQGDTLLAKAFIEGYVLGALIADSALFNKKKRK